MMFRRLIALGFMVVATVLGVIFLPDIDFPVGLTSYFQKEYYSQFGPLAISIELLIAGVYLLKGGQKANFTLALFGFTALLDPIFDLSGIFTSAVPIYASVLFTICAVIALRLAFTNTFDLGRISFIGAFGSFLLGAVVELFFNTLTITW